MDRFHSRDQFLDHRCYAATLVYLNAKQTGSVLHMELCLIVGGGSKSGQSKGYILQRVPSVVTNQGERPQ